MYTCGNDRGRERMGYLELENYRELWHFLIDVVPLGA